MGRWDTPAPAPLGCLLQSKEETQNLFSFDHNQEAEAEMILPDILQFEMTEVFVKAFGSYPNTRGF